MSALGQLFSKILPFRLRGSRKHSAGARIGVYVTPDTLWALVLRNPGREGEHRVEAYATEKAGQEHWPEALYALCHRLSPRGAAVSIVLAPAFYSLLLVDAPPVEPDELREAVKWRVKDLVNHPVDALVVDAFLLPKDAYRGRLNMVYAAVTDKDTIRRLAPLERDSFTLESISIQELALIRTGHHMPTFKQGGTALLQIDENGGAIHLMEGGNMYLSRTLDLSVRDSYSSQGAMDNEQKAEKLALDVQRSLDYYESQIGKPAPARVAWVHSANMNEEMAQKIKQRLTVNVVPVDLAAIAAWDTLPDEKDHLSWAVALGAALDGGGVDVNAAY